VTAFFVPGLDEHERSARDAYRGMREQIEQQLGRAPRDCRIAELWARRGNIDCVTIVGQPDPICGDMVMAIFDMGPHQPFVVYHRHGDPPFEMRYELLSGSAYDVAEFDA
jgi:hypothetical protein